jgi:C4-dicarboxylate transporter DctM subunit
MSPMEIGIIGLVVLFLLMFAGMHIGFAMALVGFVGYVILDDMGAALSMIGLTPYTSVASYVFSVVPLFLLMGEFASYSGLMRDTYRAMYTWVGHLPGGLSMATVGGCAGFAAISGSSVATAATMTRVCLPEMLDYKYDPRLATGCIAAGGTMGILIPPSLGFIVYGLIAEQSIGALFMAGIFPGLLEVTLYWITIYILCKRNPLMGPPGARASWRQRLAAFKQVWGIVAIFLLVMGGIWGGIFTPTEAAGVGTFGAFLFALGRRQVNRQNLTSSFTSAITTTGMCFAILIGAMIFSYFITLTGLPMKLASFVAALPIPPLGILVCILFVYLILGCIMDGIAMTLITVPIFLPVINALGFDLIWFGVLITVMAEIGLITPPIGMNVFVISGMAKDVPMYAVFRGILPFFIADLWHIGLLVAFPQISLFLPATMMATK